MNSNLKKSLSLVIIVPLFISTAYASQGNNGNNGHMGNGNMGNGNMMGNNQNFHNGMHRNHNKGQNNSFINAVSQLNLSQSQQIEIKKIIQDQRDVFFEKRNEMQDLNISLLEKKKFDKNGVMALIQKSDEKRKLNKIARFKSRHQIYKLLTKPQQEQIKLLLKIQSQQFNGRGHLNWFN